MSTNYRRSKEEIEKKACKWWPTYLLDMEAESSIIPLLIRTQDQFISILTLANSKHPETIFNVMEGANFPANLFLKHLMVLTDFGSEPLQRINRAFSSYFPSGQFVYAIDGNEVTYSFSALPSRGVLNNKKMRTDVAGILVEAPLSAFYRDLIILLLFGSNAVEDAISNIFSKCLVGNMMGQTCELKEFIKQRYIFVSRITGGAQANELGNFAQMYAKDYLERKLGSAYTVISNGHIPGVSHNNRTETTFDLSVEHNGKYVAIEISFQVTTNSTIERKAGQARARKIAVERSGNFIAYIIDGAGNFQRKSALTTICQYSHCTVAYTNTEFDILIDFIREKIG